MLNDIIRMATHKKAAVDFISCLEKFREQKFAKRFNCSISFRYKNIWLKIGLNEMFHKWIRNWKSNYTTKLKALQVEWDNGSIPQKFGLGGQIMKICDTSQ